MRMSGLALASLVTGVGSLMAADVYLASDGQYFSASTGWSPTGAPSSGNVYIVQDKNLSTVSSSSPMTFGGTTLKIVTTGANGTLPGFLTIRTTGKVTVADLRLSKGTVQNAAGGMPVLAGTLGLSGYGYVSPSLGRDLKVESTIVGMGQLRVKSGQVIIAGTAPNTYSVGTLVENDATYTSHLHVQKDEGLGTGNVALQGGTKLTLSGGVTHNYIANSASLLLPRGLATASVNLNFTGVDQIGALSFSGGSSWEVEGTWGAPGNAAANHTDPMFTGAGLLRVGLPPANLTGSGVYFGDGTGWSVGGSPNSGYNYFTGGFNLLTPTSSSGPLTFLGNRLTVGPGAGLLVIRIPGTVIVPDLRLNGGSVQNWGAYSPAMPILAGKITLNNFGQIRPSEGRNLQVDAVIDGSGQLRVRAGKVVLNASNLYAGGTHLESDPSYPATVEVKKAQGLGFGDVRLDAGAKLILNAPSTQDYIGDGAALILPASPTLGMVDLNFSGTDRIDALYMGGVLLTEGTWGGAASSATHKIAAFTDTGTGVLQVGPPSVITNSLGEKFINPVSHRFNGPTLDGANWAVHGSGGNSMSGESLVLSTYRVGTNKIQPMVRSKFETLYGRYEGIIYTHTLWGVCNAFYTVKPTQFGPEHGVNNGNQMEWQEIDILEVMGDQTPMQNVIWGFVDEIPDPDRGIDRSPSASAKVTDGWHMWAMEWTPNNISFYLDGKLLGTKPSDSFNNATAKTMYPQKIDLSNWIPDLNAYSPDNPVSTMLVDRINYYPLDMKTIDSTAYTSSSGGPVVVNGNRLTDLNAGESVKYAAVNLTGYRNVTFEIASAHSGRVIEVRKNNPTNGEIIATVQVPNTGGWGVADDYHDFDDFTKASADLKATGTEDIFLTFKAPSGDTNPIANIRKIHFHGSQPTSNSRDRLIHAVNSLHMGGGAVKSPQNEDHVSTLKTGAFIRFDNIDFTNVTNIKLEIARHGPANPVHKIQLRKGAVNAPVFAELIAPASTGAWRTYQVVEVPVITAMPTDTNTSLWITFDCTDANASAGNLRSIRFTRPRAP